VKSDRIYHFDKDDKVISVVRREPQADQAQSNADDLTDQLTTMSTRDRSQRGASDPNSRPARPHITQRSSEGPVIESRGERYESGNKTIAHQLHPTEPHERSRDINRGVDAHLSNRSAQEPQKHSYQELSRPVGLNDQPRSKSQRQPDVEVKTPEGTGIGSRRLEPISEVGTHNITRITGDDRYRHETIDLCKFLYEGLPE
jgi:hypothetical protein